MLEAVCQFDEDDAHIVDHRQKHLADVFRLARFRSRHVETADFCDALHKVRHVRSEALFNPRHGIFGVFDGVVKESGGERRGVHAHVGENMGDLKEMGNVQVAGAAELVAMPLGSNFVSAADDPRVFGGAVLAKFFEELFEAGFQLPQGAVALEAQRNITRRRHILV